MKLCRFNNNRLGLIKGTYVHDVTDVLARVPAYHYPLPNYDALIAHLADLRPHLVEQAQKSPALHIDDLALISPIAYVGKIVAVPVNYKAHLDEARADAAIHFNAKVVEIQTIGLFLKATSSVVGPSQGVKTGHMTYRAVLPTSEMPEDLRWWSMVIWAGEKTHLVQYPMRSGELFNLVAVFHSDKFAEGWDSYGEPDELYERSAKTCAPVRTMLGKINSWRMWVLCDRPPISNWSQGRMTLLGNAAHPKLQYLAQGACMAIEDSVCLARKIETCHGAYDKAFIAYQQERYFAQRVCSSLPASTAKPIMPQVRCVIYAMRRSGHARKSKHLNLWRGSMTRPPIGE